MPQPLECCCARVVVKRGSPSTQDSPGVFLFTLSASLHPDAATNAASLLTFSLHIDCPEEEATYIITKGEINDPGNGKDK